jgi:Xaa-Pro aminopeptidase
VAVLATDAIYLATGDEDPAGVREGVRVVICRGGSLAELRQELRQARIVGRREELSASVWEELGARPGANPLSGPRMIKDADELHKLVEAVRTSIEGQHAAIAALRAGRTEIEMWTDVRAAMEARAGAPLEVMEDFLSGPRTIEVEGVPSRRQVADGEHLISDIAVRVSGYWGDTCRTGICGTPASQFRQAYREVAEVLARAIAAVRPGVSAEALDTLMRERLHYEHHSGHGLGTSYHEPPWIVPGSKVVLAPGMVIALEPGRYVDGQGVRLEDVVLVTRDGCEVLSDQSVQFWL